MKGIDCNMPVAGEVWKIGGVLCRILVSDGSELFCDGKVGLPGGKFGDDWLVKHTSRRSASFYHLSAAILREQGQRVGFEAITSEEAEKWHLALPFRAFRTREISWGDPEATAKASALMSSAKSGTWLRLGFGYRPNHIAIYPMKSGGGMNCIVSRPVKIICGEGRSVSFIDFISAMADVQAGFWKKRISDGIGLYRSGCYQGVASYYAGEFWDLAGMIERGRIANVEESQVR